MSTDLPDKTRKRRRLSWRKIGIKVGFALLVLVVVAVTIAPVYFMVALSVMEPSEFFRPHPAYFPTKFTTVIAVLISVPGAYAISRMAPNMKYFLILSLFFTRMYPEIGIALPIAVLFLRMGLYESVVGLVLAHLILVLPVCAWILVGGRGDIHLVAVMGRGHLCSLSNSSTSDIAHSDPGYHRTFGPHGGGHLGDHRDHSCGHRYLPDAKVAQGGLPGRGREGLIHKGGGHVQEACLKESR